MKTVYTADRAEGGLFVCFSENGDRAHFPAESLPAGFGEGWRIVFEDGGDGEISEILPPDEEKIKSVRSRFDKIFKKNS